MISRKRAPSQRNPATRSGAKNNKPPSVRPSQGVGDGEWVVVHEPSWTLEDSHAAHVHLAADFLLAVPGGCEWRQLLKRYIRFEGLSPSIDVSMFGYPFNLFSVLMTTRLVAS